MPRAPRPSCAGRRGRRDGRRSATGAAGAPSTRQCESWLSLPARPANSPAAGTELDTSTPLPPDRSHTVAWVVVYRKPAALTLVRASGDISHPGATKPSTLRPGGAQDRSSESDSPRRLDVPELGASRRSRTAGTSRQRSQCAGCRHRRIRWRHCRFGSVGVARASTYSCGPASTSNMNYIGVIRDPPATFR